MDNEHHLFADFSPVSRAEWEKVIKKDLNGADYKTKLKWHTGEGIEALPFYRRDDLENKSFPVLKNENNWEIRQLITDSNVEKANRIARKASENGADALTFLVNINRRDDAMDASLSGPAIQDQEAFGHLLNGIDLTKTGLHFDAGRVSPAILAMLHNQIESQHLNPAKINGSVLYDPYAAILTSGQLTGDEKDLYHDAKQMVDFCSTHLPSVKCLGVDARIYHNAGGTIIQQLGYALATGSEWLAMGSKTGLQIDAIASAIHFHFSIGSSYFLEIAKFRAARKLWRLVLDTYNVNDNHKMDLHGVSSSWNKTLYDACVNMLRTTTEGMSAAIAGCDAITLHPFDASFRSPDDFSRRIARNAQIILKEEAHFNEVADPSAGSYYIEILTEKMAKAAWSCFQQIEQQGGMLKSIKSGYIQSAIEESRQERDRAIASRGHIFVGTNQYPDSEDAPEIKNGPQAGVPLQASDQQVKMPPDAQIKTLKKALQNGCLLGDFIPALFKAEQTNIQRIRPYRGAEAFEKLRQATEKHDHTPHVLMLPFGDKKMRKARSAFAGNFFGCAGYHITDPIGFKTVEEAIDQIANEQPDVVVLCGSDETYVELVPSLCGRLKKLDQPPVTVLAGYPKEQLEPYKNAGVDLFIHRKSNVLKTLKDVQKQLGVIN